MLEFNKIYNIDNVQGMMEMDDECIDLTVTSPPYDNLRTYNGFSFDFENVAKQLYRVTKAGGVVVWVVGDATINGSETGTSFKQALYFMECGFNLHDTMIYRKQNPLPQSNNRYCQAFEYMFVLSKGKPKTFNGIRVPCNYAGHVFENSYTYDADGSKKLKTRKETSEDKLHDNIFEYFVGFSKNSDAAGHPAIFPQMLVRDQINTWSNEKDVVLDPFMGSGTTAKVARALGRKYIGFEISREYCDLAQRRLDYTYSFLEYLYESQK